MLISEEFGAKMQQTFRYIVIINKLFKNCRYTECIQHNKFYQEMKSNAWIRKQLKNTEFEIL